MAAAPAMANINCEVDMGSDERINIAPTNTLDKPQRKLTSAGELPTPIGFAKEVGKAFPQSPATGCGTLLQKKTPHIKSGMSC
jgi:hypothetical protein